MAQLDEKTVGDLLEKFLPTGWIEEVAREVGAVKRQRRVRIVLLVWSLVLGFASSARERSLAASRRLYEEKSGDSIEESSFYKRFNAGLAQLMKECFLHALENVRDTGKQFQRVAGPLQQFADVVITDASVVRLHKKLQHLFPGARTNHSPAALKLHTIVNVKGSGISVRLSEGKKADIKAFRVGPWVSGKLLLFDLGYFCYNLFNRIERNGGYFVSRLKDCANPDIVGINLTHRGRKVPILGRPLREVVGQLKREVIDISVTVTFKNRTYNGKQTQRREEHRVIGIRNSETAEYHLFITNVPPDMLSAEEVAQVYRYRWEIELIFKEMKSYYHLEDVNTRNEHVLMVLLYATLITWVIARALRRAAMRALPRAAHRLPARRFAAVFAGIAANLLELIVRRLGIETSSVERSLNALLAEIVDPNFNRGPAMAALGG